MSKQSTHWIWYLGLGMITASAYAGWAKCAVAQITADGTLPNNSTNIAPLSREELERLSPNHLKPDELKTNDITAVSQQNPNLSGRVNINTPNVDPTRTLTELPAVVVDTSMIVDSTCAAFAGKPGNQFTITGRGGLPPSPNEPLTTDVVWLDTRLPITTAQQHREEIPTPKLPSQPEAVAIVPATGWVFNGKGQVTLISSASHTTSLKSSAASCPQR